MAYRATKSGINADQTRKVRLAARILRHKRSPTNFARHINYKIIIRQQEASYDKEAEDQAKEWIEAITGEEIGENFFEGLRDGSRLCR